MQGRLSDPMDNNIQSFPVHSWKSEFQKAEKIGFELIEWVFDCKRNPINNLEGINEIKSCLQNYDVGINSVCADYFMEKLLFSVNETNLDNNIQILTNLIKSCHKLEIGIIEIPLVDSSSLKNESDINEIQKNLESVLKITEEFNVILAFETDLPPILFKNFLQKFNHPNVMANYDVGNSTANEFDLKNELEILKKWIKNIHVKDRLRKGITVPLGTGNTNFDLFFSEIAKISYGGDYVIQGARKDLEFLREKPEETCKNYLDFTMQYLDKYVINI